MTTQPPYDRPVRRCIDELPPATRTVWRTRYLMDDGAELRALAAVDKVEIFLRAKGEEVTIRTVWMELANQASSGAGPDFVAAAALAGLAMGLTVS